ncbi:hypothetical protein ACOME3_007711 [Neoechinorhynchus agilis]
MSSINDLPCAKINHCECETRLDGKTVVITGANVGIGFETARSLAARGCKLIMACRNEEKASKALDELKNEFPNADLSYKIMDLNSLQSVKTCGEEISKENEKIDILINNAGIITSPTLTDDGFDIHFQANHLGHFLFTNLLLEKIKKSQQGRVINVSSIAHRIGVADWSHMKQVKNNSWFGYGNAKLYNILFTKGLAKRLEGTKATANCLHPGSVKSNFAFELQSKSLFWDIISLFIRPIMNPFLKNSQEGAQTSIHLALCPQLENVTGKYFSDCKEVNPSQAASNEEDMETLWEKSMEFCGLVPGKEDDPVKDEKPTIEL